MKEKIYRVINDRNFIAVFCLISAAFAIRLISLHFFHFIDSGGGSDSFTYAISGKNLFSGNGLSCRGCPQIVHPPFYSILIGFVWLLTNNLELSGQLVSVITGALLVVPVYYLAKKMYGKKVALLSAIFIVIFPALVYGSTETFSESLYTLLLITGIALYWKALYSKNVLWMALVGLVIGLCFLTHPMGIIFIPLFSVFLLFSKYLISKITFRMILKKAIIMIITFIITCSPYWIFLHKHTGEWMLSGTITYLHSSNYITLSESKSEEEVLFKDYENPAYLMYQNTERQRVSMIPFYLSQPGELLKRCVTNLREIYFEVERLAVILWVSPLLLKGVLGIIILFLGIGIFIQARNRKLTIKEIYLIFLLLSALIFLILQIEHRYFYPYIPIVILLMTKILIDIQNWLKHKLIRFNKQIANGLICFLPIALVIAMATCSSFLILHKKSYAPYEYKIMGEWMKENIEDIENKTIMSRRAGVPFYATSEWNPLYYGDYQGMIKYAKSRGIDYLIIDEYTIPRLRPRYAFLLEENQENSGLEVIHTVIYKERKTILYRVV